MKNAFAALRFVINIIALLMAAAGVVLTLLGGFDFIKVFSHLGTADKEDLVGLMAIGLLQAVDLFLLAIVFFVLSLGLLLLFRADESFPIKLPEWLHVKSFMELKVILWESILTTMIVAYVATLVRARIKGEIIDEYSLLLPAGVLLIAISLFFLKKGES